MQKNLIYACVVTIRERTWITKLIHLDVHRLLRFPLRKSVKFTLKFVHDYLGKT